MMIAIALAKSFPKLSRLPLDIAKSLVKMTASKTRTKTVPANPSSSATTAKMKSVCFSGKKLSWLCEPCPSPFPHIPPDPTATVSWGPQSADEMMIGWLDFAVECGAAREGAGVPVPERP